MMPKAAEMSLMGTIRERTSVRSYTAQKLDAGIVRDLLAAAVRAPTAMHAEPWAFVVVQDSEQMRRLSDRSKRYFLDELRQAELNRDGRVRDEFARPEFNLFYNAGTLILICGPSASPLMLPDCWLAAENLMLAACARGLGTCVIGSAATGLNRPESKAELDIPADYSVVAPIIVGFPDGETEPTPRKAARVLAWH